MIPRTPIHDWIAGLLGVPPEPLRLEHVRAWQLAALRRTVEHAKRHSPVYAQRLDGVDAATLTSQDDLARLPFTTAGDLRADPLGLLCVSQGEIERVVTMDTSGTTGDPKRLFFTRSDLERTVDFFAHGMATMAGPGGRVLLFMPGERPGSVGDLLTQGLARMGAQCRAHGFVQDLDAAVDAVLEQRGGCLVGIPAHVLAVARHGRLTGRLRPGDVGSVLLSGDPVSPALRQAIAGSLGCGVFVHYGLTETGLGGGVECRAHAGVHLREADLLTEIVDPATGRPALPGEEGEIVLTTLTRRGMPLIRYRTGDAGRLLTGPCPCGTPLPRLAVRGRADGALCTALDDALWPLADLSFHEARIENGEQGELLRVTVWSPVRGTRLNALLSDIRHALQAVPAFARFRIEAEACGDSSRLPLPGKRRVHGLENIRLGSMRRIKEGFACPHA